MINKAKILKSVARDKHLKIKEQPLKISGAPYPAFGERFINLMVKLGYFNHTGDYNCPFTIEEIRVCFKDRCNIRGTALCANTKTRKEHFPWIYLPQYYDKCINICKTLRNTPKDHLISWIGGNYRGRKRPNYHLVKYCDYVFDTTKKYRRQHSHLIQMPYEQFLTKTAQSKFCLCLPGFGSKCHREIEALSVGTVLAITEGVNVDYFNKLVENKHYVIVKNEQDIKKLKNINKKEYSKMSRACSEWFDKNISPPGAYEVTKKLIHSIRNQ